MLWIVLAAMNAFASSYHDPSNLDYPVIRKLWMVGELDLIPDNVEITDPTFKHTVVNNDQDYYE